jgi:hypothetical protein
MAVIGYRPTKRLKELLTIVKREMIHGGWREYNVSVTLMTELGYFQEISMDAVTMGNHISSVLTGTSPALKEETYRTVEACLQGETEKLGMQYRFDYINQRFAFSLRRPSSEHSNCRSPGTSGER